jgi:hypothetical protein
LTKKQHTGLPRAFNKRGRVLRGESSHYRDSPPIPIVPHRCLPALAQDILNCRVAAIRHVPHAERRPVATESKCPTFELHRHVIFTNVKKGDAHLLNGAASRLSSDSPETAATRQFLYEIPRRCLASGRPRKNTRADFRQRTYDCTNKRLTEWFAPRESLWQSCWPWGRRNAGRRIVVSVEPAILFRDYRLVRQGKLPWMLPGRHQGHLPIPSGKGLPETSNTRHDAREISGKGRARQP